MGQENDDLDDNVNSIIAQIKNQSKGVKKTEKTKSSLRKEELEEFVIENAATVVENSVEMIQELKDTVMTCDDSRIIEATAELVKAVTGAIESLSKLKLADDKIKNQKELKQMDIDAKIMKDNEPTGGVSGLFISRQDLLKEFANLKESTTSEDVAIDV